MSDVTTTQSSPTPAKATNPAADATTATPAETAAAALAGSETQQATGAENPAGEQTTAEEQSKQEQAKAEELRAARLAAQIRKEKALLEQKRALAAERERLKAEREQSTAEVEKLRAEIESLRQIRAVAKSDPLKALEELGLSYEQVTEAALTGKAPAELATREVREEIEKLRAEIAEKEKAAAEERKQAAEAQRKRIEEENARIEERWRRGVVDNVTAASADFPLVTLYGQQDAVAEIIRQNYQSTQRLMDWREAATLLDQYLRDQVRKGMEVVQPPATASDAPPSADPQRAAPDSAPSAPKTLTNSLSASTVAASANLSDEERARRAEAIIRARFAK